MNIIQRISKNITVLFIAQIVSNLLAFFYMIYAARYLGPASFGIISFAIAFTGIFSIFTDFGLSPLAIREVARDKSLTPKYLINITFIKIVLGGITFGLIVLTINFLGYPKETIKTVYLLALSVIFTAFTEMFYSIFNAHEKMEYQSFGQIINSILVFSGVLFAVRYGFGVVGFASLFLLASIIVLIYSFVIFEFKLSSSPLTRSLKRIKIDWDFWKFTIKEALPFMLTTTFVVTFQWTGSVILSLIKGNAEVGWYSAAYKIAQASLFIPSIFMTAIYPITSIFFKSSPASLQVSLEKSFKYLTILGIPLGIGMMLLAKRIILIIFGIEYSNSVIVLQILSWSSVFVFLDNAFANLLNSINRQMVTTKIMGVCLGVNILLNLILIPKYSLVGAGIAVALTQFMALLLILISSSRIGYSVFRKVFMDVVFKAAISSIFMGLFIIYFHNLNLLVLVALAALLYFIVLCVFKGINKDDLNLMRAVVRKDR